MARLRALWFSAFIGLAFCLSAGAATSTNLVFDALLKEYTAKVGEATAEFDFSVTNTGPVDVTINSVRASCGCTTPKMPPLPWTLKPNEFGSFHATVDLRGKIGTFQKSIMIESTEGPKMLYIKCILPLNADGSSMAMPGMDARTRNMQLAHADRQIVFRNDCASCHAKPTVGKKGEELFTAACAICHEAEHRAATVPDLHALKQTPTPAYWDAWIRNGKVGSMMPAFALDQKGPLSDDQIGSLVDYLMTDDFKNRKPTPAPVPTTASVPAQPPLTSRPVRTLAPFRNVPPPAPLPGSEPLLPPGPPAQRTIQ
jgi:cytochrome c553